MRTNLIAMQQHLLPIAMNNVWKIEDEILGWEHDQIAS